MKPLLLTLLATGLAQAQVVPNPNGGPDARFSGYAAMTQSTGCARETRSLTGQQFPVTRRVEATCSVGARDVLGDTRAGDVILSSSDASVSARHIEAGVGQFTHAWSSPGWGLHSVGASLQAAASVTVPFRVDAPNLANGTAGYLRVPLLVNGRIGADGTGSALRPRDSYGDMQSFARLSVQGRVESRDPSCGALSPYAYCPNRYVNKGSPDSGLMLPQVVWTQFDFRVGEWTSYSMSLWVELSGQANAFGLPENTGGADSAGRSSFRVDWGGIEGVFLANGTPVQNWSVLSLPGVDLAAPVPEPGTWALMVGGLLGVGWLKRRR
jgi:PEP-CTERM motif